VPITKSGRLIQDMSDGRCTNARPGQDVRAVRRDVDCDSRRRQPNTAASRVIGVSHGNGNPDNTLACPNKRCR
jgi:hypothetical protein